MGRSNRHFAAAVKPTRPQWHSRVRHGVSLFGDHAGFAPGYLGRHGGADFFSWCLTFLCALWGQYQHDLSVCIDHRAWHRRGRCRRRWREHYYGTGEI